MKYKPLNLFCSFKTQHNDEFLNAASAPITTSADLRFGARLIFGSLPYITSDLYKCLNNSLKTFKGNKRPDLGIMKHFKTIVQISIIYIDI